MTPPPLQPRPDAPLDAPLDAVAAFRAEDERFVRRLHAELEEFLDRQRAVLAGISADALPLLDAVAALSSGGKRLRARLCYWGWRAAGGDPEDPAVARAGAALELFQSAALIHDDVIDRSDTRRGAPSVHRRFEGLHAAESWQLDGPAFGVASAILAGDLCLSWSEQLFAAAAAQLPGAARARAVFDLMRSEVMVGQYLDVQGEVAGAGQDRAGAVQRALDVIRYKSAKYSVEHPVALGAALAGADEPALARCSAFALPLGEAFQLRDDVLGVFGDPATTGKPAGDDLREGKRTVLVGFVRRRGSEEQIAELEAALGSQDLDDDDVRRLRALITACGALQATEELIDALSGQAFAALDRLGAGPVPMAALRALATAAVRRAA
ncbi:polyprenyl synthetase family protein [Kocuria rosea]|jgi:geranylgeranyl diphosphate synthase type I|uniref:polyprenyl synthetase family protein n=1 Tax=Kocuria rosea TaxID=1275 RepID=UPI00203C79CE|nr:polyprenyl synthetase family protein [Kocuria rosea]MCM3688378.1 polyprenyl synthetase family protein [Kocuria rosea]